MRTLNNLEEIIRIGLKFKFNWFRGHSKPFDDLTPKIFRKEFYSANHLKISGDPESHAIEDFKRLAPSIVSETPNPLEHLQWLVLMQHFGAPTRLLDWSESILVATFFAVTEHPDEDAEIWRLYPYKLNLHSVENGGLPITSVNPQLKYLAAEPTYFDTSKLVEKLNLKGPVTNPIAFTPVLNFPRITAQDGAFTIHPKTNHKNSLKEIFKSKPDYLNKYLIPSKLKSSILQDLFALGINNRFLMANLDGLSKDLCIKYNNPFWKVWGQPKED